MIRLVHKMLARFLLEPKGQVLRVKSWRPSRSDRGWFEWPTMLVDLGGYQRATVTPVWNWDRIKGMIS